MSPPAPIRAGSHGHQPALQSDPLSAPAAPASSAAAVVPASSPDAGGISPQEGLLPQSPKGPKRQDGSPRAKTPPPSPGTPRGLKVREHPTLGPFVAGLTKRVVSWPGLKAAYEEGQGRRAVGSTGMNTASSRSHAIFTLDINQVPHRSRGPCCNRLWQSYCFPALNGPSRLRPTPHSFTMVAAGPEGGWYGDNAELKHPPG